MFCYRLAFYLFFVKKTLAFWDDGTTTEPFKYDEDTPRQGFFRWQKTEGIKGLGRFWLPSDFPYEDEARRRLTNCVCGLSIDFLPLSTGIMLNRRTIITAANFLEPYINRMKDVRLWALGRSGRHYAPYRYRIWRWRRLIPKSLNPEHYHGPRGRHIPRHDIAIMNSWDCIYMPNHYPLGVWQYAYKGFLGPKTQTYVSYSEIQFVGSGFEYMTHIKENYKIFFGILTPDDIRNCEKYLPKWWGKFVCINNRNRNAGLQNGGGLFIGSMLNGLGCFEIRYNEERMHVFTDLRYYNDLIQIYGNLTVGEYYEYAYQQYGNHVKMFYDGSLNEPYIPARYHYNNYFPLGKK